MEICKHVGNPASSRNHCWDVGISLPSKVCGITATVVKNGGIIQFCRKLMTGEEPFLQGIKNKKPKPKIVFLTETYKFGCWLGCKLFDI